jgi:hypothetical protein
LQHIRVVLQRLRKHKLVIKRNKCTFGAMSIAYLGHVIDAQSVTMNTDKVEAIRAWSPPRTVGAVRSFLRLTGYYQKFIRPYGEIVTPLTQLLKQEAFRWTSTAEFAFGLLKAALTSAPVL